MKPRFLVRTGLLVLMLIGPSSRGNRPRGPRPRKAVKNGNTRSSDQVFPVLVRLTKSTSSVKKGGRS